MTDMSSAPLVMRTLLRAPTPPADALRTTGAATLRALPAILYVSLHYWLVAAAVLWLLSGALPFFSLLVWPLGLVLALVSSAASWVTAVRFIEVEAALAD